LKQIDYYHQLLSRFSQLQGGLTQQKIQLYQGIIDDFIKMQKRLIKRDNQLAGNFNPLQLLNVKFDETTHSNILAWVFDPYGSHSQGDLFFRAFLEHFNFEVDYEQMDYKVIREFSGNEAIIDLLIYGRKFIFYIENKTLSSEGYRQTEREYNDLLRLSNALKISENIYAIYLSPSGRRPQSENWLPISYAQLSDALANRISHIRADYVRFFLNSWITILKEVGV
jgi:hypothetical protein